MTPYEKQKQAAKDEADTVKFAFLCALIFWGSILVAVLKDLYKLGALIG
jgi:hypothetical protein